MAYKPWLISAMGRKKKITITDLAVTAYAAEGKCIVKHDEKVVFVEGVVPGDVVDVLLTKNKQNWAEGHVLKIKRYSEDRITPFCAHFGTCGGCKWQMLPYQKQLVYKENQVKEQLQRIGKIQDADFLPIQGAQSDRWYRNKLEFTFSTKRYLSREELDAGLSFDQPVVGFHAPRLFDKVIDIETCYLQPDPSNAIKNFIRSYAFEKGLSFYDIRNHEGLLRNLMIRVASKGQVLVNVVFGENNPDVIFPLLDAVKDTHPITSLHYTINTKLNDSLYDQEIKLYAGLPCIEEHLEDFVFEISPKSFFQTNTRQAEALYRITREFANPQPHHIIYDLYCGTGSIGIFMSHSAGKIVGVDSIEDAIQDARLNAARNQVQDASFYAGDVIKVVNEEFFKTHGRPDIVIIDPPRAGCHEDLINKLLFIEAPVIVYVSCNPATQARDLLLLSQKYYVEKSQAVDLFPHTHHVENVARLVLRSDSI